MLDQWILDKPASMLSALLIIGCDPLRTLQHGARAVHGWVGRSTGRLVSSSVSWARSVKKK